MGENGNSNITDLVNIIDRNIFVIPMKTSAVKCFEYRTISLISQLLKALLRVIYDRIYIKEGMSDIQFVVQNGLRTREALFNFKVPVEKYRDINYDI